MKHKVEEPSKIMQARLIALLQTTLPEADFEDFEAQQNRDKKNRQFAPEYSQMCYNDMLQNHNKAIGNYFAQPNKLGVKSADRD